MFFNGFFSLQILKETYLESNRQIFYEVPIGSQKHRMMLKKNYFQIFLYPNMARWFYI